jgi:hypothetical protein
MANKDSNSSERVHVRCESCGEQYQISRKAVGRKAKCRCGHVFIVPQQQSNACDSTAPGTQMSLIVAQTQAPEPKMPRILRVTVFVSLLLAGFLVSGSHTAKVISRGRATGNYNLGPLPIDRDSLFNSPAAAVFGFVAGNVASAVALSWAFGFWGRRTRSSSPATSGVIAQSHPREPMTAWTLRWAVLAGAMLVCLLVTGSYARGLISNYEDAKRFSAGPIGYVYRDALRYPPEVVIVGLVAWNAVFAFTLSHLLGLWGRRISRLSVFSLAFGLLGLVTYYFLSIPGLACGLDALKKIRKSGGTLEGRRLAIAGVVVSGIGVLYTCVALAVVLCALLCRI